MKYPLQPPAELRLEREGVTELSSLWSVRQIGFGYRSTVHGTEQGNNFHSECLAYSAY